jgi:hypothetical protein
MAIRAELQGSRVHGCTSNGGGGIPSGLLKRHVGYATDVPETTHIGIVKEEGTFSFVERDFVYIATSMKTDARWQVRDSLMYGC